MYEQQLYYYNQAHSTDCALNWVICVIIQMKRDLREKKLCSAAAEQ